MLYPNLNRYCASLPGEFSQIPEERKIVLQQISEYVSSKHRQRQRASLVVICTHNSRRSHLGQAWLQTAANYYGIEGVQTYSGGTEATAFHPNAVACLRRAGFSVEATDKGVNPVYRLSISDGMPGWLGYSKRFDDVANPRSNFCAILVCTDADQRCPVVSGADQRLSVPFHDPKAYDHTPQDSVQYDRSCRYIAREMAYAMSLLTTQ